jgi:hypothetical protein
MWGSAPKTVLKEATTPAAPRANPMPNVGLLLLSLKRFERGERWAERGSDIPFTRERKWATAAARRERVG